MFPPYSYQEESIEALSVIYHPQSFLLSNFQTYISLPKLHQVNKLSHTDTTFRSHSMQEKTAYLRPALGVLQRKAMETEEEKEQRNNGCRWSDNSEGADDWVSTRERD